MQSSASINTALLVLQRYRLIFCHLLTCLTKVTCTITSGGHLVYIWNWTDKCVLQWANLKELHYPAAYCLNSLVDFISISQPPDLYHHLWKSPGIHIKLHWQMHSTVSQSKQKITSPHGQPHSVLTLHLHFWRWMLLLCKKLISAKEASHNLAVHNILM